MVTKNQRFYVKKTLKTHRHKKYTTDILLSEAHSLKNFIVYPNVLRPELVTPVLFLARFLFFNNGLYFNKVCLDMGCGSGVQGIVMSLYGAKKVIFSDISHDAVKNTKENVSKFKVSQKSQILEGDLFEKILTKFDIIVFNHPFFPENPIKDIPVSSAILDSGNLIHRFLKEAKTYLKAGGKIIMPFYDIAGVVNDPKVQAPKHSYKVRLLFTVTVKSGLQLGKILIYELQNC